MSVAWFLAGYVIGAVVALAAIHVGYLIAEKKGGAK